MQALSACVKLAAACSLPCCIIGADLLLPVLTLKLNRAHKGFGDLMRTPTLTGNLRSGSVVRRWSCTPARATACSSRSRSFSAPTPMVHPALPSR